jgi:hypothetical protein
MKPECGRNSRTRQLLRGVAAAFIVAGCGSTPGVPDGGALVAVDSGFHYTELSAGTATFGGALTGTFPATAFGFSNSAGFLLLDGGNSGPYVSFEIGNAINASGPLWVCTFELLPSTTLDVGPYAPTNVSSLVCEVVIILPDGGPGDIWSSGPSDSFGAPNIFELSLTSPGPESSFSSGSTWNDPSASVLIYLAPSPDQSDGGVAITATVAPPPCPRFCAPNSP